MTNTYTIEACLVCHLYVKREKVSTQRNQYSEDYFNQYPYAKTFSLNKRYFSGKLQALHNLTRQTRPKVLDVGCGWGDFLEVVDNAAIPYLGIDTSDRAIALCKKKGLKCTKTTIGDYASQQSERFNGITCFQTIEHLTNPLSFLESCRSLLTKHGVLLLTTPNNNTPLRFIKKGNWSVYNTDSHYTFFNKTTLAQTLQKAGFSKIKVRLDPPRFFSLDYILNRLNFPFTHTELLEAGGETPFRQGYRGQAGWDAEPDRSFSEGGRSRQDPRYKIFDIPIPTDPFGDLEAIAYK